MIYSLKKIAWNYIKSGWFFLNLLACIPGTAIAHYIRYHEFNTDTLDQALSEASGVATYFFLEVFKLCRLLRLKGLLKHSIVAKLNWEIINVETALILKFIFMIGLISHWIACLWGMIAFLEARSFGDPLLGSLNWISHWYNGSYVEGGLNPIGWENYLDRYWLCLFWSIQSITSIG